VSPINETPRVLLYSRLRRSPYFHASREHGVAMYSVYNHTYHPRPNWMVDLEQKDDFIGGEALARIKAEGPTRRLAGVETDGPGLGPYNDGSMIDVFPVHHDGRRVGEVTSACFSPRLERKIGYAMVPVELAGRRTRLEVEAPSGRVAATVVEMPFVGPKKEISKQRPSRGT
jgi:glycine cleavage system aminomethyltransferase T